MSDRSILRVKPRPHVDPSRPAGEWIVEVWRAGEVVATIYGTREGVQIVSEFAKQNEAFYFEVPPPTAGPPISSYVFPLLTEDEPCPWCAGGWPGPCPVCESRKRGAA
jgi:hypothetical protein